MVSAITRTRPAVFKPITTIAKSKSSSRRSKFATFIPCAWAKSGSKQSNENSLMRVHKTKLTTPAVTAISIASARTRPAVDPRIKSDRPACPPTSSDWINVSKTMPSAKKVESTVPIAVSSVSRVRRVIHSTAKTPMPALNVAPNKSNHNERPSPKAHVPNKKASAIPGNVAWLMASLTSARFRNRTNTPIAPAPAPKMAEPINTKEVLYPACKLRAKSRAERNSLIKPSFPQSLKMRGYSRAANWAFLVNAQPA